MAEANGTQACAHCGAAIEPRLTKTGKVSKHTRRYCSSRCLWAAHDDRRPGRQRKPLRSLACHGCGLVVSRRAQSNEAGRYCSRACNTNSMAKVAAEVAALRRIAHMDSAKVEARAVEARVLAEIAALRRIAGYVERPMTFLSQCRGCGSEHVARRNGGLHRIKCDQCLLVTKRKHRRVSKSKRRAIERGAQADRIDPVKVFERDRWVCHMCKRKTLREKRGTHDPRAPELDHLVTLADGGAHTWGNVACSCRQCNHMKGARSEGQLGLPFAA